MHVVIYFKCLPQIYTKMNGFNFDFSKIFLGGAHQAPPQTPPPFYLGLRPRFGFAFNSQALRAFYSGFALDYRALRALIRTLPSSFDWGTWFGPQNKFLDLPLLEASVIF